MVIASGLGAWLVSAILVTAALGKLVSFRKTVGVLEQIGLRRAPRLGAAILIAAEFTVAVLYLARPGSVTAGTLVLTMFAAFAAVGARELRLKRHVRCGCFGGGIERELGWPQIVQLPVVLAIVLPGVITSSTRSTQLFLAMLVATPLAASLAFSMQAIKPAMRTRRQRVSLAAPGRSWKADE